MQKKNTTMNDEMIKIYQIYVQEIIKKKLGCLRKKNKKRNKKRKN
jgi:hypothetical protein